MACMHSRVASFRRCPVLVPGSRPPLPHIGPAGQCPNPKVTSLRVLVEMGGKTTFPVPPIASPRSPRGQSRSAKQTLCAVVSFFLRNSAAMLSTPLALLFDIFFIVSSISCSVRRRLIVAHSVLLSSMVSSSASTGPGFSLVQCCPLLFDLLALVMEDALCVFNLTRPHTGFLTIGFHNFP